MADDLMGRLVGSQEPEWLEKSVLGNLRAWHVIFLSLAGVATLVVVLCCCVRFRIPRTKQQIEADYHRREITRKFHDHLKQIHDSKMDTISLKDALELLYAKTHSDMEGQGIGQPQESGNQQNAGDGVLNPGNQKPEPQATPGNFAKLATKIATISKFTGPKSPTSPTPSDVKIDF